MTILTDLGASPRHWHDSNSTYLYTIGRLIVPYWYANHYYSSLSNLEFHQKLFRKVEENRLICLETQTMLRNFLREHSRETNSIKLEPLKSKQEVRDLEKLSERQRCLMVCEHFFCTH